MQTSVVLSFSPTDGEPTVVFGLSLFLRYIHFVLFSLFFLLYSSLRLAAFKSNNQRYSVVSLCYCLPYFIFMMDVKQKIECGTRFYHVLWHINLHKYIHGKGKQMCRLCLHMLTMKWDVNPLTSVWIGIIIWRLWKYMTLL